MRCQPRWPRSRAVLGALALALLLPLLPRAAGAPMDYVPDELLWMKAHWQEYKLPFPWSTALRQRDAEATRQLQGPLQGFAANSMNGPLLEAGAISKLMEEDAARWAAVSSVHSMQWEEARRQGRRCAHADPRRAPLARCRAAAQQSSLDLTLLDEEASQEMAASVAQCKVGRRCLLGAVYVMTC